MPRRARPSRVHFFRHPEAQRALALLFLLVGCNVYYPGLIDSGSGGSAGTLSVGGTGGSAGAANSGGTQGVGGSSGAGNSGSGSASGGSGSSGDAGADGGAGEAGADGGDTGSGGAATGGAGNGGVGGGAAGGGGAGNGGGGAGGGGTGNGGGGIGAGGAGNGGSGGGGAGNGGAAGAAGMGGSGEVCSGCARLAVPLAAAADKAHFTITLPAATDLSAATIAFRVARYAGTGGSFRSYIQEGSPNYLFQSSAETTIASIGTSMQTVSWDVATAGTNADKTIIRRIGIELSGGSNNAWTNPTVLYVDSIVITGTTLTLSSFTFDTASTVYTTPTSSGPNDVIWLNNYSGDTNVTGAAVSWLGP